MSEVAGSNGANGVVDPQTAQAAIKAVAAAPSGDRPFNIPEGLAQKIAKAKKAVQAVPKNGRNNDQKYDYVKAEDVVETARQALNENDVVVLPPAQISADFDKLESRSGNGGMFVKATFAFRVVDGETGEGVETMRVGTATDYPGDKAIFKAETGATKYFLSALLNIPLGDGNDPETTEHAGGGARTVDPSNTKPATDPQKKMFKDRLKAADLPRPAVKAIVDNIGGEKPMKGPISEAIDRLVNGDGLGLAKDCGWNGEVEEATPAPVAAEAAEGPADDPKTIDAKHAEGLLTLCREKQCQVGEVVTFLTTVGVAVPEGDDRTKESVQASIGKMNKVQAAKFETMVVNAAQAKEAATASTEADAAPAPAEAATEVKPEADPNSPLGEAQKVAERLGFSHELSNVAWLLFDTENAESVPEAGLKSMTAQLERAHKVGINASSLGACTRQARESKAEVNQRSEQFEGWIKGREEKAQQTAEADSAAAAAEGSQE